LNDIILKVSLYFVQICREHAPVALGAAGARAVVAETYARIFFRNLIATGELYPIEKLGKIEEENHIGDYVTPDMGRDVLINHNNTT
jgi:3-isopropylmalate/(R)-2-methylmalate dehydratase small subunit